MTAQKRPAPAGSSGSSVPSTSRSGAAGQHGSDQGQNWKKRKQERAHTARFIEAQAPAGALSAGSSRATSKSSTPVPVQATTAAQGLPSSIELESLVSSRAFQIQSFLRSIKSAKSATTTRAWQLLPRHARRRAASHNLLRLPSRLRSKALAELRSSTTQARSRSDIRKRLPSHGVIRATLRRKKLAERASHPKRRWLETHMWHAKRFRMTTEKGKGKERDQGNDHGRWGFVLPETTMMKSHRASWRSALEFVTVHDASYVSVFRLGVRLVAHDQAKQQEIERVLSDQLYATLADAGLERHPDVDLPEETASTQVIDTVLQQQHAHPDIRTSRANGDYATGPPHATFAVNAALAPVRIVLLPGHRHFEKRLLQGGATIYYAKEALLFVHPAADLHVRRALKAAKCILSDENKNVLFDLETPPAQVVQAYAYQLDSAPDPWLAAGGKDSSISKLEKKRRRQAFQTGSSKIGPSVGLESIEKSPNGAIHLDDTTQLRRQQGYNIFELIGPRAPALLLSVLKLHHGGAHKTDAAALHQLLSRRGRRGNPLNAHPELVALEAADPRLSYPPKLKPPSPLEGDVSGKDAVPRTASREPDLLWTGACPPRFSKGEIDSRRALNGFPGARLQPDARDDPVPVVLIRDHLVQTPHIDRYTLIVPRGWGSAFLLSLVATHQSGASSGARVLGQHQLRHQKLELAALAGSSDARAGSPGASVLAYPYNWLGTQAHAVSEKAAAEARHAEWSRRPKGKRPEYLFATHHDWKAFLKGKAPGQVASKLSSDRTGVARPHPFGGSHHWEWLISNSQRLFGGASDPEGSDACLAQPWLVAQPEQVTSAISSADVKLVSSHLALAIVAIKLQAVRKGTVAPISSLMLPPSFEEHLSWVHHLDVSEHPAMVANRSAHTAQKMDKQHLKSVIERRCELMQLGRSAPRSSSAFNVKHGLDAWSSYLAGAADPEAMHDRSADWNNAVGVVLDGDYSLGNGRGFGIGAITLRGWAELMDRQRRLEALRSSKDPGGRRARNVVITTNLLLMREPGTDVVRAVTATCIPLA